MKSFLNGKLAIPIYILFFFIQTLFATGQVVHWNGTVDSNRNIPSNWSSGLVPGTYEGDTVVLNGNNNAPVIPTVVVASKACAVHVYDEASLEVCKTYLKWDLYNHS